ncbi:MAG: membrane fusion protein (multidrug efflux system), partial [Shewanella sp.]
MSINKRLVLVPGIIVVLVVAGVYWWSQVRYIESTDNAYVEADISN